MLLACHSFAVSRVMLAMSPHKQFSSEKRSEMPVTTPHKPAQNAAAVCASLAMLHFLSIMWHCLRSSFLRRPDLLCANVTKAPHCHAQEGRVNVAVETLTLNSVTGGHIKKNNNPHSGWGKAV